MRPRTYRWLTTTADVHAQVECGEFDVCGVTTSSEVLCWGPSSVPRKVKSPSRSFDVAEVVPISTSGDDGTCGSGGPCATLGGALGHFVSPRMTFQLQNDVVISTTVVVNHYLARIEGSAGGAGGRVRVTCDISSGSPCLSVQGSLVTIANIDFVSTAVPSVRDFILLQVQVTSPAHDSMTVQDVAFTGHVSTQPVLKFECTAGAR